MPASQGVSAHFARTGRQKLRRPRAARRLRKHSIATDLGLEEFESRLLLSVAPNILLTPTVLSGLRQQAAANTPAWQAFKSRLDQNLLTLVGEGSYQGSELPWISDYALGYQVLYSSDPTTASAYADKAIGLIKSGLHDYQAFSNIDRQFLSRGDGQTRTFALPNADVVPSTIQVWLAPTSVYTVQHGSVNGADAVDYYQTVLKVSNTPDGNADYAPGSDWQRNDGLKQNMLDWSPAGKEPAAGATYYVTTSSSINVQRTSFTLSGSSITLPTAPSANQAVYVAYIYGTHAADGSRLAYQQTSGQDGGFNSIYVDSDYTARYLGKHLAMGLDWLDGYAGLTPALRGQVISMLGRWFHWLEQNGYYYLSPASNYGAGSYVSNVLTALALSNRDPSGPALLADMLQYRQGDVVPLLSSGNPSLAGGFWAEGWNYGQLASQNVLLAGLALESAGQIPQADAERHWAGQVTQQLIHAQPTLATVYDGGDWYASPAPFPGKELFVVLAAADSDPTTRGYDNYILQRYPGDSWHDALDLLYHDPNAQALSWTGEPLQWFAPGTGLVTARSDWGSNPDWVSLQVGNLLYADHQTLTPGQLQIQRGGDDLLVNVNSVSGDQWPKLPYGNNLVVDDNGDGAQTYRFAPGVWYGSPGVVDKAYEATNDYVYLYGDYHAAYSPNSAPGSGGSTSELTRQMVYVRPNLVVVYDRVTTIKASYPKQLHWHFLAAPAVNGNGFVVTQGQSRLFGQTFSTEPLATSTDTLNMGGFNVPELVTQNTSTVASVRYVTAFEITDSSTGAMLPTRQVLTSDARMEGSQVGNYLVLFGRNGDVDLSTPVTYQVSGSTAVSDLLTNLSPGQSYQVLVDGILSTTVTASSQGTISFTTPGGNHTIQVGIGGTPVAVTATHFAVNAPASATAGGVFSMTVTALDASGNVVPNYTGTVHFSSTDATAGLPADYTFTSADAGAHTFTVTLTKAGSQTLSAADLANGSIAGSDMVSVIAASASQLNAIPSGVGQSPSSTTAGTPFTLTVVAYDAYGNVATGYTGTVRLASSDAEAMLPAAYTFTAADAGSHTFSVTLCTAGAQSVQAVDTANTTLTAALNASVSPAAVSRLTLSLPATASAGGPFPITVTALDPYGNVATGYGGAVHFSSSDPGATLPADYTFTAADGGSHSFSVTLVTSGSDTVTATDTVSGTLAGTGNVSVSAPVTRLTLTLPTSATAGGSFTVTVRALDASGNIAAGYRGTVHFSSSDPGATLPADYTFTAADAGVQSFTISLVHAGSQTLSVADKATASVAGSGSASVKAAAASHLALTAPASVGVGVAFSVTVTAYDPYGNVATGYAGTVRFSSSDATATLPASYSYQGADQGVHTFQVSLRKQGTRTLTVGDTSNAAFSATTSISVSRKAGAALQVGGFSSVVAGASTAGAITPTSGPGADGTLTKVTVGKSTVLFVVRSDGSLWRHDDGTGWRRLGLFVRSVSATASATDGVTVFAVTDDGALFRHSDTTGWRKIGGAGTVSQVIAFTDATGRTAAFVLTTDGILTEYRDASGWRPSPIGARGTIERLVAASGDRLIVLTTDHSIAEFRSSYGWLRHTGSGFAKSASVTTESSGNLVIFAVTMGNSLYRHDDQTGWAKLGDHVQAAAAGTDTSGRANVLALTEAGDLFAWDGFTPRALPSHATPRAIAGGNLDRFFAVFGDGTLSEYESASGWSPLTSPGFIQG